MGRKSLGSNRSNGCSPILRLRLSIQDRRVINLAARNEGLTISEATRAAALEWARKIVEVMDSGNSKQDKEVNMKTIGLWIDSTDGEPVWVVSRDTETTSDRIATFDQEDYADALLLAKDECQRTGFPVVKIDEHCVRETIYEIDHPVNQNDEVAPTKKTTVYVCSNIETLASGYVADSGYYEESIKSAVGDTCREIDQLGWADSKPDSIFSNWHGGRFCQFAKYKGHFIAVMEDIDSEKQEQLAGIGSKLCGALAFIGEQEDKELADVGKVFLVVDASGEYLTTHGRRTPASNEAVEFETRDDAEQACERETDKVIAVDPE